ncbi:hypothetical protein MHU86_10062 [Fragilaria crotonensis]|nr:hypothetical protein MHU86_10062 [Fragilaria crotonensis]
MWRRWIGFGRHTGYTADPFLALLSNNERELYTKAFLQCYRVSTWSTNGDVTGTRPRPLVASTVRQAAGHLAAAFRNDLRPSPIHVTGSSHLRPFIRALFRSYENDDPPRNQQRAITPKLLRAMYLTAGTSVEITRDTEFAIISELAIMAYFFAMRSCEFTLTRRLVGLGSFDSVVSHSGMPRRGSSHTVHLR